MKCEQTLLLGAKELFANVPFVGVTELLTWCKGEIRFTNNIKHLCLTMTEVNTTP